MGIEMGGKGPCCTAAGRRRGRQGLDDQGIVRVGGPLTVSEHGMERHQNSVPAGISASWSIRSARSSGGRVAASERSKATWMGSGASCVAAEAASRGEDGRGGRPYATMGRSTTFSAPTPGLAVALAGAADLGVLRGIGIIVGKRSITVAE